MDKEEPLEKFIKVDKTYPNTNSKTKKYPKYIYLLDLV